MSSNWAKLKQKLATPTVTTTTVAVVKVKNHDNTTGSNKKGTAAVVATKIKRTDLSALAEAKKHGGKLISELMTTELEQSETPYPRAEKGIMEAKIPTNLTELKPPSCAIDWRDRNKYIGLDCEMVGIGIEGKQSALARCSMVDFDGKTIFDEHVRPPAFVTDFRTKWSGVRKHDLRQGHAISLQEVCVLY
jgi:hypothetical protein